MRPLLRRLLWPLGILAVLVLVGGGGLIFALTHPRPVGVPGPEADALARRIERAVDAEAWARTGAVRFVFFGTEHLWDRERNFDRQRLRGGVQILLDVNTQRGLVTRDGTAVWGAEQDRLIRQAYARFCNDTFWLNPLVKLFDEGVTRSRVLDQDGESLIVHYASGGMTPGDTYQWIMGEGDLPRAWRLFVQVLKFLPGVQMSWEDWTTLPTGAKVAVRHRALGRDAVRIEHLAGAASVAELEPGPDPFAGLRP